MFVRDPFSPICFSEDLEKNFEEESIISIFSDIQDVLELKEEELILLQDETDK